MEETINGFAPGILYEVVSNQTEGQTEALTRRLTERGAITQQGIQKSIGDVR